MAFRARVEDVRRRMISSTLRMGLVPSFPSLGEHASSRRKSPSGGNIKCEKHGATSSASSSS